MSKTVVTVWGVMVVLWACAAAWGQLQEGVLLEADGAVINVEVGHLVPVAVDWNEDGRKDLLVGQFKDGKIGLYLNEGTDKAPKLKFAEYLKAGGEEISLPFG